MVTSADIVQRENIHNFTLRQEYADSTQDSERAKFILLQLEASNSRKEGRNRKYIPLRKQADKLLRRFGEVWTPDTLKPFKPQYIRGFVEEITLDAGEFLERGKELYALAPIRHLRVYNVHEVAKDLFESPLLEGVVSLICCAVAPDNSYSYLVDDDMHYLAQALYVPGLFFLDVTRHHLTDEGFAHLARSTTLTQLQYVAVAGNNTSSNCLDSAGIDGMSGKYEMTGYRIEELARKLQGAAKDAGTSPKWLTPIKTYGDDFVIYTDF